MNIKSVRRGDDSSPEMQCQKYFDYWAVKNGEKL